MESLISTFPIVVEQQPWRGRRGGCSTFVRAHVMERYHRQRRTIAPEKVPVTFATKIYVGSIGKQPLRGVSRKRPKVEGEATFIEFVTTLTPRGGNPISLKVKKDTSEKIDLRKKNSEVGSTINGSGLSFISPGIVNLQLRDPRIQQSLMFMEISRAYFQMLDYRQMPLDLLSKSWLTAAFADLALFHAIVFNFSQQLYALCSIDHEKPTLLVHKVDAIREISARMKNQVQGCSDAIIASILCLISHELLNKNSTALGVHMRGLRQIINIRGGVDMLGLNGTLKTVYLNYELLLATVLKSWLTNLSPSLFMPNGDCFTIYPMQWNIFTLGQKPIESTAHCFSDATIQILCSLERMFFNKEVTIASDIISPQATGDEIFEDAKVDHVLESLRLAMALSFPTLDIPPTRKVVERLKHHLNMTSIESFWHPIPGALLFCFLVGMAVSRSTPYRPWFVANLIRLTTSLAFENWEGLKESLRHFTNLGIVD